MKGKAPIRSTFWIVGMLVLFLIPTEVASQEKEIIHRGEQWLQYNLNTILAEKWSMFGNLGFRWRDGFEEHTFFWGRAGCRYSLTPTIRVATGFTYVEFKGEGSTYQVEFRPYEELLVVPKKGKKIGFSHRFRFEQRFYNPVVDHKVQSGNTFAVRLRYALSTRIPIAKLSESNPDCKLILAISDEVMVNAGKEIVYNVFDKNRFVITPTLQFNKWMSMALGYNFQFFNTTKAGQYIQSDVMWFHLSHTFNFSKKKMEDIEEEHHVPVTPTVD